MAKNVASKTWALAVYGGRRYSTNVDPGDTVDPTAPVITATADDDDSITIALTTPSTDASGIDSYELQWSANGSTGWTTLSADATFPYPHSGLTAETEYFYRARATDNATNVGAYSSNTSATTDVASGGGSLVHGQAFVVNGSGFGTRPDYNINDLEWQGERHIHSFFADFAGSFPPAGAQTFGSGATFSTESGGPSRSGKYMRVLSTSAAVSKGLALDQTPASGGDYISPASYTSFKFRGNGAGKIFRKWNFSQSWNWYAGSAGFFAEQNWPWGNVSFYQNWSPNAAAFERVEILDVPDDTTNGASRLWVNGDPVVFRSDLNIETQPTLRTSYNGFQVEVSLPNSLDDGGIYEYTDIYHDWTAARVVVSDGTHSEPQLVTSWTPGQIACRFNRGELSSGAATVFIYDASNTVVHSVEAQVE